MRKPVNAGLFVLVAVLLIPAGCYVGPEQGDVPGVMAGGESETLHSFEDIRGWSVSAVDAEEGAMKPGLSCTDERVTLGLRAMALESPTPGVCLVSGKLPYDISTAYELNVDVRSDIRGCEVAVRLGIEQGWNFTTEPKKVGPGWNKLRFSLLGPVTREDGALDDSLRPPANLANLARLSFLVRCTSFETTSCRLVFDNLHIRTSPAARVKRPQRLEAALVTPNVSTGDLLDLWLKFDVPYKNPFDPAEVEVYAQITTPAGARKHVRGYVHDVSSIGPEWRVRYRAVEPGRHTCFLAVRNPWGELRTKVYSFEAAKSTWAGMVRVSKGRKRSFESAAGKTFYPVGQNVAWARSFDYYFDKISGYGGNYARVWISPWTLPLEKPADRALGTVDLHVAKRIDELFASAAKYGIRVQLVTGFYGALSWRWKENPYNVALGGPCATPVEFFTSEEARRRTKLFLDYVIARWGHSPSLFALELFHEADLTGAPENDLVAWYGDMRARIRETDPYGHMVTISFAREMFAEALLVSPDVDFLQLHVHSPELLPKALDSADAEASVSGKPYFVGEYGPWSSANDESDPQGLALRAGLWLSFVSGSAGTAMPWWWDTHIDPLNLYSTWKPVATLARRDYTGAEEVELVNAPLGKKRVRGKISRTAALLYVYDEKMLAGDADAIKPAVPDQLPIEGMLPGQYRVSLVNPADGRIVSDVRRDAPQGRLIVNLPKVDTDLLVLARAVSPSTLGLGSHEK